MIFNINNSSIQLENIDMDFNNTIWYYKQLIPIRVGNLIKTIIKICQIRVFIFIFFIINIIQNTIKMNFIFG